MSSTHGIQDPGGPVEGLDDAHDTGLEDHDQEEKPLISEERVKSYSCTQESTELNNTETHYSLLNRILKIYSDTAAQSCADNTAPTSPSLPNVGSNVYARPFVPSMNLVESLDKRESHYSTDVGGWQREEYIYTGNNSQYNQMSVPRTHVMGTIPHRQYTGSQRNSHRPHMGNEADRFYYPEHPMLVYEQCGPHSRVTPSLNIDHLEGSVDRSNSSDLQAHPRQMPLRQRLHYHRSGAHSTLNKLFVSESLRNEIIEGIETARQVLPANGTREVDLDPYYGLYPLSRHSGSVSRFFGYSDVAYKAFYSQNDLVYVLRRIKGYYGNPCLHVRGEQECATTSVHVLLKYAKSFDISALHTEGFTLYSEELFSTINQWVSLKHPNIVSLKEAFTTKAFGDSSLIFVYDYHPLASTLERKRNTYENNYGAGGILEKTLWTYIVQIVGALKSIHAVNLAARVIDQHNIIVTEDNRLRINSCGIVDTMAKGASSNAKHAQIKDEDLYSLGNLIIYLATGITVTTTNISKSLDIVSKSYSQNMMSLVLYLIGRSYHQKSLNQVTMMISSIILEELCSSYSYSDFLKSELTKELQNGRFIRLLCKLGFINERPEFGLDPEWSETGDRYLIKLFRDYIFHQVDENMRPLVDIGHVLNCLNKLDCGVDEKIMLTSRDEQSNLIVSYKELKKCIGKSFSQLLGK